MLSTLTPLEAHHVPPDFCAHRPRRSLLCAWRVGLLQCLQRYRAGPGPSGRHLRLAEWFYLPPLIRDLLHQTSQGARHLVESRGPGWRFDSSFPLVLDRRTAIQPRRDPLDAEFELVQAMAARDL